MKKLYILLLFIVIILSNAHSQNFEGRIVLDDDGYINVQFRNTTGVNLPNTSTLITDFEFDIRWLKAQENGKFGDIKMICHNTGYPFEIIEGSIWPQVNYNWQFRKVYITGNFYPPNNWVVNEWETVFLMAFILDDANWHWLSGALEIGEKDWGNANKSNDPIIKQDGSAVNEIDVLNNGLSGIQIPTGVKLIWVGGANNSDYDEHSWNFGENWEIICPDGVESNIMWAAPRFVDDCTVPVGRFYYPKYTAYPNWESTSECNNLNLEGGAEIAWQSAHGNATTLDIYGDFNILSGDELSGFLSIDDNSSVDVGKSIERDVVVGNLFNEGFVTLLHNDASLNIANNLNVFKTNGLTTLGQVNVGGNTDIDDELGLVIKADETGVGSFINEGDINFDSKAGAMVETYISGTVGNYFMHFAGPTVLDSTNFYNGIGNSGVRLEQFNMTTLDTYTYEWNPLTDTTDHSVYPWVNVYPFWHNVQVAKGLAISNLEEGTGTMQMVGKIITDEVSYTVQSFPNNNLELISNPFSSAIDFADLYYYGNNSEVIKGHYWIYDASTGNYYGGALGSDSSMIQVGQGFFVEVNGNGGELVFNPTIRNHDKVAFRETNMNILKLRVLGGDEGYKDELTISFDDNATGGYDENLEVKKWNSFGMDATMIRSIADDGSELSVNALPTASLSNPMTSIPIHFECGYDAEYTFNFSGMETFEYATSIWIEDLQTGIWNSVSETNPTVTFNGSPEDDKERFVLHFVGPTNIFEADAHNNVKAVDIYASNNTVYIRNNSEEIIKEILVFNLLGQEIGRSTIPDQSLNQIYMSGNTSYYVVRVYTDQSIYTEKIFIK